MAAIAEIISDRKRVERGRKPADNRLMLRLIQAALVLGAAIALMVVGPRLSAVMADVLGYLVWGVAMLVGGMAALVRSRLSEERMRLRWMLLGISLCGGAAVYLFAASDNYWTSLQFLDPGKVAVGCVAGAALLLSITVSFNGAPKSIVVLDLLQTALYIGLSYVVNVGSNPWAKDVQSHVISSLLLAMMMFLTALVAPLSATTREERSFFKLLAVYLGGSWVGRFMSGQVGYIWMHASSNLYALPAIGVCVAMALYLMDTTWHAAKSPRADRELGRQRLMLRNLMPSMLAVSSLLIALYVFLHSWMFGLPAVFCAVVLYLSRTLLLQSHMTQEAVVLRHRNEQLEEITQRDALTGAGNRRSLAACYERLTAEDEDGVEVSVALLLVDIDFFKQANDVLGHLHGDRILITVTNVLRSVCCEVDGSHVARFGGDEFALLLPRVGMVDAAELAEAVRAGVAGLALDAGERTVSTSIGGALTDGNEAMNEVIRRADVALYQAKLGGRDRVEFDVAMNAADEEMVDLAFVPVG